MNDSPTIRHFVCTHNPGDGRPETLIEVFRHGQGNAGRSWQRAAREMRRDASVALKSPRAPFPSPSEGEARNAFIERLINVNGSKAEAGQQLGRSFEIQNHHHVECSDCGYTERVSANDIETLMEWGTAHGLTAVPLQSIRRILRLLDRK